MVVPLALSFCCFLLLPPAYFKEPEWRSAEPPDNRPGLTTHRPENGTPPIPLIGNGFLEALPREPIAVARFSDGDTSKTGTLV